MEIIKLPSLRYILLTFLLLGSNLLFAQDSNKIKRLVPAIVVTTEQNPNKHNFNHLNGEQIIALIDSLLELNSVSDAILQGLSDYAENKRLEEDIYISLT